MNETITIILTHMNYINTYFLVLPILNSKQFDSGRPIFIFIPSDYLQVCAILLSWVFMWKDSCLHCRPFSPGEERGGRGGGHPGYARGARRGGAHHPPARHQYEEDTADFPASPPQGGPMKEAAYHREDREFTRSGPSNLSRSTS